MRKAVVWPRVVNGILAVTLFFAPASGVTAQEPQQPAQIAPAPARAAPTPARQNVIFDTDIGDDIDDVLALGLALSSPELRVLGVTTAWGNTALRARMVDRLFQEAGIAGVPVLQGPERHHPGEAIFSQAAWARGGPDRKHEDAVQFILQQANAHPNDVTLISVAPMSNLGAAIDRDPAAFRKLRRIVLMGGSVRRGYGDYGFTREHHVDAEYNIAMDPVAAEKVFRSGVPLYVMPLDSTQIKLNEVLRSLLFTHSSPLTDALALNYQQWSAATHQQTPTMYDAVAVAFAIDPALCPVTPLHLTVDAQGYTRESAGAPNVQVCLKSDSDQFFEFFMPRLLQPVTPNGQ